MKPARCRRDEGGRQFSDPPAAVPVDRIATRRPGIASRVALRLLIAGSGARLTGRFGRISGIASRLIARFVVVRDIPSPLPLGIWASDVFTQPTDNGITSRWMRRREAP